MEKRNNYGYMTGNEQGEQWIRMRRGQNISGTAICILYLDNVWYPMMPGNVVNSCTYDFPVRLRAVPGLDTPRLHSGDPTIFDDILREAKVLEKEGVRAISAACGFFGHFHRQLADAMDIPVAMSSLVQAPWIKATLKKDQKIGVLTANAAAVTDELLSSCGIEDSSLLKVADLRHGPHFSAIMEDRGEFDNNEVRKEVLAAASELTEANSDIGAILLECSDMPPYAAAIQAQVGLPVFDFITMIKWLHSSVNQTPYKGWI